MVVRLRETTLIVLGTITIFLMLMQISIAYFTVNSSFSLYVLSILVVYLVFSAITMLLIERMILRRIDKLNEGIINIGKSGNISSRLVEEGDDELSSLSKTINKTLETLEQSQKDLKESEDKYRSLFENTGTAMMILEEDTTVSLVNKEFENISGYSKEEVEGSKIRPDFASIEEQDRFIKYLRLRAENPDLAPRNYELRFLDKYGNVKYGLVTVVAINGLRRNIVSLIDITKRKKMEEELKGYTEHLEELVKEETKKLHETERLATIGQVAAMIGHDLRNPLQVLLNINTIIKTKFQRVSSQIQEDSDSEIIKDLLKKAGDNLGYMNKIVSDLQDYARPLKPELIETNLEQLINETLSTIRTPKNIKINFKIPKKLHPIYLEPMYMKRVFTNLIINALQAMPEGGQLTIEAAENSENVSISFRDTGAGIAEENISKLFQPLFTTKAKGQGLGLAVCHRLVEAQKGAISIESKEGEGSTFIIKMPLKKLDEDLQ